MPSNGPQEPSRLVGLYVGTAAGALTVLGLLLRLAVADDAAGPVTILLLVTGLLLVTLGLRGIARERARR